jgi:hypothetical protein
MKQYETDGTVPTWANEKEVQSWIASSGTNYIDPDKNFKGYWNQSVERDARQSATEYVNETLNRKSWQDFHNIVDPVGPATSNYA